MKRTDNKIALNYRCIDITSVLQKNTKELWKKGFVHIKYNSENTSAQRNLCTPSLDTIGKGIITRKQIKIPTCNYIYTLSNDFSSMKSIKSTNIILDIKKIMMSALSLCLGAPLLPQSALSLVLQGVCACAEIKDMFTIAIDKEEALIMIALWKEARNKKISVEDGLTALNRFCNKIGEREFSNKIYQNALDRLDKIKSIIIKEGIIILKERVSKKVLAK